MLRAMLPAKLTSIPKASAYSASRRVHQYERLVVIGADTWHLKGGHVIGQIPFGKDIIIYDD